MQRMPRPPVDRDHQIRPCSFNFSAAEWMVPVPFDLQRVVLDADLALRLRSALTCVVAQHETPRAARLFSDTQVPDSERRRGESFRGIAGESVQQYRTHSSPCGISILVIARVVASRRNDNCQFICGSGTQRMNALT